MVTDDADPGLGRAAEADPDSVAARELEELREAERPWRQASVYAQVALLVGFVVIALLSRLVPYVVQLVRRLAGT